MNKKYQKPKIKAKKIKLSYFMSNTRFLDSVNSMGISSIKLAQDSCSCSCLCGSCWEACHSSCTDCCASCW